VTSAAERDHFVVLFQDDVLVVVEVEQADGVELARHAARSVHGRRGAHGVCCAAAANAQRVDDALDRGVVGRVLVLAERERALTAALVRVVALRRDDPPGPADLLEVHVHLVSLTRPTSTPHRRSTATQSSTSKSAPHNKSSTNRNNGV